MRLDDAYKELGLVQDYIPRGNSNRPGTSLHATSITIHNTDNTARGAGAAAHARYQKGPDAQKRQVSWHFTVDDHAVYQSLPTNEVGWHTATREGNTTSIGVEICMNQDLDEPAAYARAALLVAVMARKEHINVPTSMYQHHDWSGKNCPIRLRSRPGAWDEFKDEVDRIARSLVEPDSDPIEPSGSDHHGGSGDTGETELSPITARLFRAGSTAPTTPAASTTRIAWGRKVSAAFRTRILDIAGQLDCDASHLMAAMAFETGESFSPSKRNRSSGATGLIQFIPSTARRLGTTTDDLAAMSAVQQLDFVEKYLMPFKGRMRSLSDVYMTILFPVAVGKPEAFVLFEEGSREYEQNRGLDLDEDGQVTKGEAAAKVHHELQVGLSPANLG